MQGLVVSLHCGIYSVNADGVIYNVPARGLFRKNNFKVMVGDYVELNETSFVIENVYPRKSTLIRPSIANVSQAMIVLSIKEPSFSYLLAFKYLTYSNMNNLNSYLILTKVDSEEDIKVANEIKDNFEKVGIKTILISNKTNLGVEEVKELFKGNLTCLIGQSGVGKSSLLNNIDSNYNRDIGEYSKALGRGKHETKEVILLPYMNGYIADTPGFSSLDLNLKKSDLAKFFPSFHYYYPNCFFSNCLHTNEKKCAVKEAFDKKELPSIAYECYLKLLEESEY